MFLVLQYDNRPINNLDMGLINRNVDYCNQHKYHHRFITQKFEIPPYWIKVMLMNQYIHSGEYEGVLWIDTDACIHDKTIRIEDIVLGKKSFYMSPGKPVWNTQNTKYLFNAGVFLVLHTSAGKDIMNEWMNSYNEKKWYKNDVNQWLTSGEWAGETYEQGCFSTHIMPKYINDIHAYDWKFFQSNYSDVKPKEEGFDMSDPNDFITINSEASTIFILHFCSDKNKRYNYLLTMQQPM